MKKINEFEFKYYNLLRKFKEIGGLLIIISLSLIIFIFIGYFEADKVDKLQATLNNSLVIPNSQIIPIQECWNETVYRTKNVINRESYIIVIPPKHFIYEGIDKIEPPCYSCSWASDWEIMNKSDKDCIKQVENNPANICGYSITINYTRGYGGGEVVKEITEPRCKPKEIKECVEWEYNCQKEYCPCSLWKYNFEVKE